MKAKPVPIRKPKAWSVKAKMMLNAVSSYLIGRQPFSINPYEMFRASPLWQQAIERRWRSFWFDSNLPYALGLLIVCAGITVFWWAIRHTDPDDLWSEMGGMTLDVLFILVIFAGFEGRRERRQEIARQMETIDDHKRWDSEEARVRLAGAIRRLNRLQITSLDLSGARLTDFSFRLETIPSLAGSTFFNGDWGMMLGDASVTLTKVDFGNISCASVTFSPFDPLSGLSHTFERHARFRDCSFSQADLQDAVFDGASLKWSELPPASHYEWIEDDLGDPSPIRSSYGPFYQTELRGASFRNCLFENADFRDAENVLEADFAGATGLDKALFDDEPTRLAVLAMAERR